MPTELPTPAKSWSQLWQMTKLLVKIWLARFRPLAEALRAAGVIFVEGDGWGPGVRLRKGGK